MDRMGLGWFSAPDFDLDLVCSSVEALPAARERINP